MQISLCPLGPYCVIYSILCILCLFVWSLTINVHNNNKNPKKNCVDCWLDLGQMNLELRQHSYAKGLGQCQLVEKPSACNLNFIWYIIQDPLEFIYNMIIVKLLFWTCDLWNSSVTWAILKKIMEWISLDVAIIIWCLDLQDNIIVHLCVAWF